MTQSQLNAQYCAGIGVIAVKFGITVKRLWIGNEEGSLCDALLEPINISRVADADLDYFRTMQIEDYATALLAGSAANFIREQDQLCHLKRSFGDAGLEMRFLREIWQGERRKPDRAMAIICGFLEEYDDGDIEATAKRLWHRAVLILRRVPHCQQLKSLAQQLQRVKLINGDEIHHFLKP